MTARPSHSKGMFINYEVVGGGRELGETSEKMLPPPEWVNIAI